MKKIQMMALAVAVILPMSCTKDEPAKDDAELSTTVTPQDGWRDVTITFGFGEGANTRATLQEASLTDLWVFDDDGDGVRMVLHQSGNDDGFGSVRLSLKYGTHALRFVASRGSDPTFSDGVLSWAKPSDTFWAQMPLEVSPSGAASQQVTLRRVATRLRISITDEIPAEAATLSATPSTWYYGLNVLTGEGTDARQMERTVTIPASYVGTSGQLAAAFFGLSPVDAWQTDVTVAMKSADGTVLGSVVLEGVGFAQNVTTSYSGGLLGSARSVSVDVDDVWGDETTGEW